MIYNHGELRGADRVHRRGTLTPERIGQLEAIPGWCWSPSDDYFDRGMTALIAHVDGGGDANVLFNVKHNEFPLGRWVGWNRAAYKQGSLTADRIQRLEEVSGWQWDPNAENWDAAFRVLTDFVKRGGNPDVGPRFQEAGFALGRWISRQRGLKRRRRLAQDRESRLESVRGWTWDEHARVVASRENSPKVRDRSDARWEGWFAQLEKYLHDNGPSIPTTAVVNGVGLGNWVGIQRKEFKKGLLSQDRISRLESLPNWRWVALAEEWEKKYEILRNYADRNGTVKLSNKQIVEGVHLARWVENQKKYYRQGTLDPERRMRLEEIQGWDW